VLLLLAAIFVAGRYALYGFFRKTASILPLEELAVETMILFIPARSYLATWHYREKGIPR